VRALALAAALLLTAAVAADESKLYLDQDKIKVASPPLELTRPDKDWVFIDVAAQRAAAAKERDPSSVEAEYGALKARLWSETARALLSVSAHPLPSTPPQPAEVEKILRDEVAARKATLVECGRMRIGGLEAVRADWVAAVEVALQPGQRNPPGTSNLYRYSKVEIIRIDAGVMLTLFFEAPKDKWPKAKDGWAKILKKIELK
jgi:hypothetical protein